MRTLPLVGALIGALCLTLPTHCLAQDAGTQPGLAQALGGADPASPAPSPAEPRIVRPGPQTPLPEARRLALSWARQARAAGRHRLVIAFEGLLSYSSSFTRCVYDYQHALRTGEPAKPPRIALFSFVSKHLLAPTLHEDPELELLILPETSEAREHSVAEQVAHAWREVHGDQARLLVVGMSFGGYAALRLCRKLEALDVPVDQLYTLDARTVPGNYQHFVTPSNVRAHQNDFQKGFMPGYPIAGAVNRRLRHVTHGRLPGDARVLEHWRASRGG